VARHGAPLEPGRVYVAPGGTLHLEVIGRRAPMCHLTPGEPRSGHRPSVDVLFSSLASLGERAVGVILTGMGADGAAGLLQMRQAGATTLGQDEATCLVYGMPRVAAEIGAVGRQLALEVIPAAVLALCAATPGTATGAER
jgi:two-component system chemotaxis response regulator CheB